MLIMDGNNIIIKKAINNIEMLALTKNNISSSDIAHFTNFIGSLELAEATLSMSD